MAEPSLSKDADRLLRLGLWLEYATLGWNLIGAPVMGFAAVRAGSAAFAGFGLDSLIEIFASVVVIWQLKGQAADRERPALRLIGAAFLLLAAYVLAQSLWTLIHGSHPAPSSLGMTWLAGTVMAMSLLAWSKLVVGRALDNPVLRTEARVTAIDAVLAAIVLVGVALNAFAGWWWADPLAGLAIVFYGLKEGLGAFAHARSDR